MRSAKRGKSTSAVEVTNISGNGFWLLLGGEEVFVEFKQFPWFRDASIGQLLNVSRPAPHHLYWPDLNVELAVESLTQPDRYRRVSRVRPNNALQRSRSRVTPGANHGSRRTVHR
jgi:hypothetical protein